MVQGSPKKECFPLFKVQGKEGCGIMVAKLVSFLLLLPGTQLTSPSMPRH